MKRILPILLAVVWTSLSSAQQPHDPPPDAKSAYDRGVALRAAKDPAGAIAAFTRAIERDPAYADAWRTRGLAYVDQGKLAEARADVDRAIAIEPRNSHAYVNRAFIRTRGTTKDFKGAVEDCTSAIAIEPGYSNAYSNRGSYKYQSGDARGALADLEKALSLNPDNLLAAYNSGVARSSLNDPAGARADFERAIAIDPKDPWAVEARNLLAKLPKTVTPATPAAPAAPSTAPASAATVSPRAADGGAAPTFTVPGVVKAPVPVDPFDRASWPVGDVLWAASTSAALPAPAKGPMIAVPGHLDFGRMSPAIYASAITAAKEGMRLLQGPLSAADERAVDAKWAPYFAYPSSEVIDYCNRLNPLLVRLLDARAGFNVAVQALQKALAAAGGAMAEKDRPATQTAMVAARSHKAAMDGYQRAMADVAAAIVALGPMPNPYDVRARHAKAFADAVAAAAQAPAPAKPAPTVAAEDYWVLTKVDLEQKAESSGGSTVYTFALSEGVVSGSVRQSETDQVSKRVFLDAIAGTAKWTAPARVFAASGASSGFELTMDASCGEVKLSVPTSAFASMACASVQIDYLNGSRDGVTADPRNPQKSSNGRATFRVTGPELHFDITGRTLGGRVTYHYHYALQKLTAAQAADARAKSDASVADAAQKAGAVQAKQAGADKAARAKAEAIAFQKEMAAYFEGQAKRAEADAARAADPKVRQQLAIQVLAYDANRAAAVDNEAYLETGQWQRTSTAYDAFNLAAMTRNAREEAARIREPEGITNAAMRQVDLMPPDLRAAVRATWESQVTAAVITSRDTAAMKRAAGQVAQQVRAYWAGVSGREDDKAGVMNVLTVGAQATEVVAGVALIGVAGAAAAGAGMTGAALWTAETLTGAAYGGATGYVQGGPEEAAKRQLQWAGLLGYAASEALDAWGKGADAGTALAEGGKALLLGKAAEIGLKWAGGKVFKPGPTGLEAAEAAEFERGMAAGKQAVARAEKAEWDLAQAISKGARQAEVDRLTREAERHAASLNADWYAKFQLKLKGPSMVGHAFDQRVGQVYQASLPDFLKELERRGYDVSALQFKPMRNPSSAGTVSMDLDLALIETPGQQLLKNGRQVPLTSFQQDAQVAWNKVYQTRTGQNATRSLLNITTSAHQEAFTTKLLEKRIPWGTLTPAEVAQAAEVLRVKVSDIPLAGMAKFVENARGLEKELRTKVMPYVTEQAARAANRGDAARAQSLRASQKELQGIYDQVLEIGKHEHAPIEIWRLQQQLKHSTGGKTMWEIADALGISWEASAKR